MRVRQLSVFLENKVGRLFELTRALGEGDINIRSMCVIDNADFGVVRMVVDLPHSARRYLEDRGFMVNECDVIAIEVPDAPGGMAHVMHRFLQAEVNVEYTYPLLEKCNGNAVFIFRIQDVESAITVLTDQGIRLLSQDEITDLSRE
ncbi:MAG: amino acid-binding protein [Armatimonadetes bacterium]|nr:amino acid-binding protein [Armatimonadota bacterium]